VRGVIFSPAAVIRAFRATTGITLDATPPSRELTLLLRRVPLPHIEVFDSTPEQNVRFAGRFFIRVTQREVPDIGVEDEGLHLDEAERGPRVGQPHVVATARRANVEVMFWPEASEVNDVRARAAWSELTSFLHHL
jgi:hypothetical protein